VLFLFSARNIKLMLRYHEKQLHFVTLSHIASIAAVLGVRLFPVNAENLSHLVSVSHLIGGSTHLLSAHRYCLYLYISFVQNSSLLFNVQRCLCAIAVSRHKSPVGGGGNFSH
jgi:hypothetical protein